MNNIVELYLLHYSSLDINDNRYYSLLSDDEKKYISTLNNLEVKKEKLFSLLLKKKYIGSYFIDEKGKPKSDKIKFNISHSNEYMVLVKNDLYEIGVDIELIREYKKDLVDKICNSEEKKYIQDDKSFFEIWTNKESLVKSYGSGIISSMKEIPSLPLNGLKKYSNSFWYSKSFIKNSYVISVTLKSKENFDIIFNEATI